MYVEGDVPVMSYGNGGNSNGWGNDWSWIIGLAIVGALFGNGGFGFGGGGRGGYPFYEQPASVQDVASGFSTSEIMSDLNDILLGQAQMQNFINQGFAGLNQSLSNGFAGVNSALCTLGYQTQQGFNGLSREIADCCCATQKEILGLKYANEKQTAEIIQAQHASTRAILDYLTGEKISSLQAENSGLKAQISNDRQTRSIVEQLRPCPVPAFLTCNPYTGQTYGGYGVPSNSCC